MSKEQECQYPAFGPFMVINEFGEMATVIDGCEYIRYRHPDPTPEQIAGAAKRGTVGDVAWEESYSLDMPMAEFEAKLAEVRASVPRGCRKSMRVSMETEHAYGDSTTTFRVVYARPETDEEWARRRAMVERLAARADREKAEVVRVRREQMEAAFASGAP